MLNRSSADGLGRCRSPFADGYLYDCGLPGEGSVVQYPGSGVSPPFADAGADGTTRSVSANISTTEITRRHICRSRGISQLLLLSLAARIAIGRANADTSLRGAQSCRA